MVYILLSKQSVTAKELADYFEVSSRTIYRDVDTLGLAGIPVFTEKGKGGGISLLSDFVLNKSILSEQEQNEILSALQSLTNIKTAGADQVLQKLSTVFNKTATNWLEVDFSDWSFVNGDSFNDFKTAILERRIAEFDYHSTYGEKTHRRIEPIQICFKSKAWYIKGFCLTRQDVRTFKLTRLKNLTVTDEHFPERDLLSAIPNPGPDRPQTNVTLKLKIASEMSHRVYDEFDEDHIEQQSDGSFIVSATWLEDELWLYNAILSFGEYAEVLEPEYIRKIMREKTQKVSRKYL
jgi:predicted DNA-binding transcriptional regulator YafY